MKILILIVMTVSSLFSYASEDNGTQTKWVQVGDMFVPEDSLVPMDYVTEGFKEKKARIWMGGILPLQFSSKINQSERQEFFEYCAQLGEFANIQCVLKQTQDKDYLYINKTTKRICGSSYVGRRGGRQELLIKCWRKRTIQHELMHALGVPHEHNRMDRDDYIMILWGNMKSSSKRNYRRVAIEKTSHYLNYYDFDSIMHYASRAGTKNGKTVFYRKDLGPVDGLMKQSDEMSFGDHFILYALYGGEKPQ